jgi:2-polyprenyl-3-methyl-5-hydroxy-6-metoxy-1,4-benzoquinol methylase
MSRRTQTLAPDYFEALYAENGDPWKFATSEYERMKYSHTLAALPQVRYAAALEVGCSIGVLTRQLASRCERLLALDAAPTALSEARRHCRDTPHVELAQMFVPREWPDGTFDLILLSEVVYYLDSGDVDALARRVEASLAPGGTVLLVHWTGETDYPLSGDSAAELFIARLEDRVEIVSADRRPQYRLDVLKRR